MRAISRSTRNDEKKRDNWKRGRTRSGAGARYEVLERVGEGTLFVAYKVRHRDDGRIFALKAVKSNFTQNTVFAHALADAAEATLQLSHPHLAALEEVGEEEGTVFVVNEWLPGVSLEERLRRAPFSRTETLNFIRQIAEALGYLHRKGAVHGDLRPHQILTSQEGQLKLTDPGLWPAFPAAGIALTDVQQDAAYYLAPECDGGAAPSPASDFYSLGVVLYRMITGRVPFDGASALSIAARHRRDVPMRPSQWNPSVSADLEDITLRLLEKAPEQRFSSAEELLAAINGGTTKPAAKVEVPPPPVAAPAPAPAPAVIPAYNEPLPDTLPAPIAGEAPAGVTIPPPARRLPKPPPAVQAQPAALEPEPARPPIDEVIDEKLGRKKQRRREAIGALLAVFWLLVAIALLGGIIYGGLRMWQDQTPRTVTVPDYRGKNKDTAEQLLAQYGLKLIVSSEVFDPKRPADTVIKGDPPAGKQVRAGREILVTVSKGQEPIKMPDLTELDLQRARQIIERSGMKLGQISDQYHDTVPKGYIIAQYPEAGQPFRRSEPISLTVSRGPQPVPTDGTDDGMAPLPDETPAPDDLANGTAPIVNPPVPSTSDLPMIARTVSVKVAIPADGQAQEVSIDVEDQYGDRTVYRRTHNPGDLIVESVRVTRQQGTKAHIRIYLDGILLREQTV